MSLFVGIPIAPATTRALQELAVHLRAGQDGMRWTLPEAWHITLQFLGESTDERLGCLLSQLNSVVAEPFKIALEGITCFERAGVVAASIGLTAPLAALQRSVVRATALCGCIPEARPYTPHLTLARVRRGSRLRPKFLQQRALQGHLRLPGFVAQEFLLYESFLERDGAHYEVRARFPLKASQARSQL